MKPTHPKLGREIYRGELQARIAEKMAGCQVTLIGNDLVNCETGEVLEAAPGECPEFFIAAMHTIAADPRFRWVGFRQGSDNRGEEDSVPLGGSTWEVADRADPSYQARNKNRLRARIREALDLGWARLRSDNILAISHYKDRFVTLTAPNRDDTSCLQEWDAHNEALERLRETKFFKDRVWGGAKNLEDPGIDHPHVHSHGIWISKYLPQVALAWEWTRCHMDAVEKQDGHRPRESRQKWLKKGWNLGMILEIEDQASQAKKHHRKARTKREKEVWARKFHKAQEQLNAIRKNCYVVDVRLVGRKTSPTTIEREEAIQETCKYVTKTTDLLKRSKSDLLALLMPAKAPRVFDTFGACRGTQKEEDRIQEALKAVTDGAWKIATALLDTAVIISEPDCSKQAQEETEGEAETPQKASKPPPTRWRPPTWRTLMGELPLSEFIRVMRQRAASGSVFAMKRIHEQGIRAWAVADVLRMGGCPDTF